MYCTCSREPFRKIITILAFTTRTSMSSRKRRRDQAFADEDIEVGAVATEVETISSEKQRAEKEQEVWDAIREAHFEGQSLFEYKLETANMSRVERIDSH